MASCFGLPCFVSRSWHSPVEAEEQCRPLFTSSLLYLWLVRAVAFVSSSDVFRLWYLLYVSSLLSFFSFF